VRDSLQFKDTLSIEGLEDLQCNTYNNAKGPDAISDTFADHFQGAEELPLQYMQK
jgi:hypothetical protein